MMNTVYVHDPWQTEHYQVRFEQMLLIDDSAGFPEGFFSGWCPGDDLATPEAQQKVYTMCIYTIYIVYNIFIFIYYI